MATLAPIAPHLTVDELLKRFRSATDPVEMLHFQIIWWQAQGRRMNEVTALTGLDSPHREHVQREGAGRPRRRARPQRLRADAQPRAARGAAVAAHGPSARRWVWNSTKVAQWVSETLRGPVRFQRGWDYLRRLGLSTQSPCPRHAQAADEEAQAESKKNSTTRWKPSAVRTPTLKSKSGVKTKRASS